MASDDAKDRRKFWLSFIVALIVAVVGAAATALFTVFSGNDPGEAKGTSASKPESTTVSNASPRLRGIHVPEHIARSPFGFVSPPEIRFQIEQPGATVTNPLVAYIGKPQRKDDLKPIRPSCISFEPQAGNQVIYTTLQVEPSLKEMFSKAPHGGYSVLLQIWSQFNGKGEGVPRFFNYVYADAFTQRTFTPNDNNDFRLAPNGGIVIEKHSSEGKYSSANIDQIVSTTTGCLIVGCYKIWPALTSSVIALEIGLVADGTPNPRFTVTLGDGPVDSYAIRAADRQTAADRVINTGRSIKIGGSDNYFAVKWIRLGDDDSECRLYVNDTLEKIKKDVDEDGEARSQVPYVHKREFKVGELAVGFFKIRLQGRGDGIILVKNLLFTEHPYSGAHNLALQ